MGRGHFKTPLAENIDDDCCVMFVIVLIGATFHYKKMEIVDIAVAVFYEMMELVN